MEDPPETVIDSTLLHVAIKLILGPALQSLPLRQCGMKIRRDWSQHFLSVGKEQRIADVEENETYLRHLSILNKSLYRTHEQRFIRFARTLKAVTIRNEVSRRAYECCLD